MLLWVPIRGQLQAAYVTRIDGRISLLAKPDDYRSGNSFRTTILQMFQRRFEHNLHSFVRGLQFEELACYAGATTPGP